MIGTIAPGADAVLRADEAALFAKLLEVYAEKRPRNLLRSVYYDGKQPLRDMGIAIPPQLKNKFDNVLGWPAKGVDALTDRSVFEGFVSATSAGDDPHGVEELAYDNDFRAELPLAQKSSAIHACSFFTVTRGDTASGEPDVLILPRAADSSAALWDRRRRSMAGFMSVVDVDQDYGFPTVLVLYTRDAVLTLTRSAGGRWTVDRRAHNLGRVTVAPLVFKPDLTRPFGHSRITREAMAITDAAFRTIARSEAQAEFYAAPQYWVLGGEASAFAGKDRWSAVMSRIKVLEPNEEGTSPTVQRFSGESPQAHTDMLRVHAGNFAGEMGLSLNSLGIVQDNPSSAEAIYAAKEDLIITTEHANRSWGRGAVDAMKLAVMLRDGLTEVPEEMRGLTAQYTSPSHTSPTAKADAFSKLSSSIAGFADTEVGLEMAGLSREQITRFLAERRTVNIEALVQQIANRGDAASVEEGGQESPAGPSEQEDAQTMKAKFDALGVAIRAGVVPEDAARRLGLDGVAFTGLQPVSLRDPNDEKAVRNAGVSGDGGGASDDSIADEDGAS